MSARGSVTGSPQAGRGSWGARGIALAAALIGIGVATYLTIEHFSGAKSFVCPESATINCVKVTTSKWSEVAGIPVAVLGLVFFAGMTILLLLPDLHPLLPWLRIVGAGVGVLSALYLVYVELFDVDAICLWCTAVHVLTLILFGAVLMIRRPSPA